MPAFVLIGLGGGLASAVLFASAAAGSGAARMLLYLLAPLPSFLAGLGWGSAAAGVSAVAGAVGISLTLGLKAALLFFLTQAAPVAIVCHLALLSRPLLQPTMAAPAQGPPGLEWYPVGRLVALATLIAGVLAALSLFVLGPDLDTLRGVLRQLIENVFLKELPGLKDKQLSADEISAITEFSLYALPAASAMTWLGAFLMNFWLAARITLASGRLMRPWPDLAAMIFPRGFGLGLAAAFALTFWSGYPALLGSGFAGAFFLAYVLMGLAIVHFVTRGQASRPFVLWGVYLALLVLNTWAAMIIALIALLEPLLPLKRLGLTGRTGPD
ncbi:MAG TPA: DUF2232 domain-containing protein [Hyphomicrobiaceae bacterium]|nr:DUF2232 domain-containing protein [Hyphomicrobiaceae bacterium]